MLELITPPDIRTLMKDPLFRKMMRTRPRMPETAVDPRIPPAWMLWVLGDDEKWKRGQYRTYDDAYKKMKSFLEKDSTIDAAIVSKRIMFPPPVGFKWQSRKFPWCARCRRPSMFTEALTHRALGHAEFTMDEPIRCWYCGIRQVALPRHFPR